MIRPLNPLGLSTLKRWEGLPGTNGKPALTAYLDSVGVPTIGWGRTRGVAMGLNCLPAQAEEWLRQDLEDAHKAVAAVRAPLSDNQYAALVLFAFNVGYTAFTGSTLLKHLNAQQYADVPEQLKHWNKGRVSGIMTEIKGLTNRRNAEIEVWNA